MKLEVRRILKRKSFIGVKWNFSELKELYNIVGYINEGKYKFYSNFYKLILNFKENNLKFWKRRYVRLYKHGINKSTKYTYFLKFGKIEAIEKHNAKIEKMKFSSSKEFLTLKYGEEKANDICYRRGAAFRNSEIQKENSDKFKKRKLENPEKYKDILNNSLGYWIKKGFSEEEAREKVKERQTTFSLEKCIYNHGSELGLIIFNERQEKWQNSLNDKPQEIIDDINRRKSFVKIKKNESKEQYKERVSKLTNIIIYDELDLREFILSFYNNSNNKYKYQPIEYFIKDLPASVYNVLSEFNIKDYIISLDLEFPEKPEIFKNGRFFQMRVNEGLLRSSYEIDFYYKLKERNIEFTLEKFYKDSKFKTDFYLNGFDLYIEIAGEMTNEDYKEKMALKEKLYGALILEPKNINLFFERIDSYGFEGIKSYIRGII